MPRYYIPARDADFEAWYVNYLAYAAANAVALGLSPAQVLELGAPMKEKKGLSAARRSLA